MIFKKDGKSLVMKIPLWQKSYDAGRRYTGEVPNLIGVIRHDEDSILAVDGATYSISHGIDLGYKGDFQEGMPIIIFYDESELRKVCKKLGLQVWESWNDEAAPPTTKKEEV